MIKWTIDDFPAVRDFCREHDISFTFIVEPVYNETFHDVMSDLDPRPVIKLKDNNLKFIFKKDCNDIGWDSVLAYTETCSENHLVRFWLPAWETGLIKKLKSKFKIYDTAVEEHDAMREAELWSVFNKPLELPDNVCRERKAWLSYNYLINANANANAFVKIRKEDDEMKRREMIAVPKGFGNFQMVGIKKIIFNDPATIVIWGDDVKTVVKAENEPYDPEKGFAMAIAKRALGNEGNYYNIFRKWLPKEEKKEPEVIGKIKDMTITDSGVVIKAEVTDENFSNVIKEVSKY